MEDETVVDRGISRWDISSTSPGICAGPIFKTGTCRPSAALVPPDPHARTLWPKKGCTVESLPIGAVTFWLLEVAGMADGHTGLACRVEGIFWDPAEESDRDPQKILE